MYKNTDCLTPAAECLPSNVSNENREVRNVIKDGESWWVAKDVAGVLGYPKESHVSMLFKNVPNEWKGGNRIATPGGAQNMLCLSEQGLYFFLNRSNKPKALPFQKWIAREAIPSIRKTGSYSVPGRENPEFLPQPGSLQDGCYTINGEQVYVYEVISPLVRKMGRVL